LLGLDVLLFDQQTSACQDGAAINHIPGPAVAQRRAAAVHRSDDILALELDLPERITFDMLPGGQGIDPGVQAAIDTAFWEEGHILLLGPPGSPQQQLHLAGTDMSRYAMGSPKQQQQQRPGSASRRHTGAAAVS
jgi:hypothetical protein